MLAMLYVSVSHDESVNIGVLETYFHVHASEVALADFRAMFQPA